MIDPKKVNLNELPKQFIDGAIGAHGKEFFYFTLTSGRNLNSFATSPKIMKSIVKWANEQLEKYEKQFGEIDMTPPEILSPIQKTDLNK